MSTFLLGVSLFLVVNVAAGLLRVALGPTQGDRMVAIQLFGTTGVAVLLLLAEAMAQPSLRDVALVFALLAVVLSVSFVKRGWIRHHEPGEGVGEDEHGHGEQGGGSGAARARGERHAG